MEIQASAERAQFAEAERSVVAAVRLDVVGDRCRLDFAGGEANPTKRLDAELMTAAAMVVGMIPMAIGGPGEEQNAALARAVIGGLLFATPTTLLIVPYLFAMLRKRNDGVTAYGVFGDLPNE